MPSSKAVNRTSPKNPLDRLNHVLHHILTVHHAQKPNLLTGDTYLRQIEHAMVGLAIMLVNLNREPEKLVERWKRNNRATAIARRKK